MSKVSVAPTGAYEIRGLPFTPSGPWGTDGVFVQLSNSESGTTTPNPQPLRKVVCGAVLSNAIRFASLDGGYRWEASDVNVPMHVNEGFSIYFSGWYTTDE